MKRSRIESLAIYRASYLVTLCSFYHGFQRVKQEFNQLEIIFGSPKPAWKIQTRFHKMNVWDGLDWIQMAKWLNQHDSTQARIALIANHEKQGTFAQNDLSESQWLLFTHSLLKSEPPQNMSSLHEMRKGCTWLKNNINPTLFSQPNIHKQFNSIFHPVSQALSHAKLSQDVLISKMRLASTERKYLRRWAATRERGTNGKKSAAGALHGIRV